MCHGSPFPESPQDHQAALMELLALRESGLRSATAIEPPMLRAPNRGRTPIPIFAQCRVTDTSATHAIATFTSL
jgi:hypothetical protein